MQNAESGAAKLRWLAAPVARSFSGPAGLGETEKLLGCMEKF